MNTPVAIAPTLPVLPTDEELRRALHSFADAAERWNQRRATGMTDEQLWGAIAEELGIFGGIGGRGWREVIHRGGDDPAVWIDHDEEGLGHSRKPGRPQLRGHALLVSTRRLLGIRQPVVAGSTIPMF
mgnify:CR=1 FL=1